MAAWDQKEQVMSPRCEDEEARLCCSAETAQQTQTIHPPLPHRGSLKRDQGTRDLSEVCTVEQPKRCRCWLYRIIDPYHKSSNNRSDKEKYCNFHSVVQNHEGGAEAQTQQLQRVAQTPARHVCHKPLSRDLRDLRARRARCQQHSLVWAQSYRKMRHPLGSAPPAARPIVLLVTRVQTRHERRTRCPRGKRKSSIQTKQAADKCWNPGEQTLNVVGGGIRNSFLICTPTGAEQLQGTK